MTPHVIKLFNDMSELTAPECAKSCHVPHSCCDALYCDITEAFAREHGVDLATTGHQTLKYMSDSGCTVPPHLRPLCTLHTCAVNSLGFKPGDPAWTRKYFHLREAIEVELS